MFDTITNLPVHALVVHAVIVLGPLSALGAVLVAIKGSWNRTYGWLVLIAAFIAAGSSVVAKESGERLASRVGLPADHAQWGKWVVISTGLLFLCAAALWWLDRRHVEERSPAMQALAVLQVVLSVAVLTVVVLAGHSGATAVWGPIVQNTKPGTFHVG